MSLLVHSPVPSSGHSSASDSDVVDFAESVRQRSSSGGDTVDDAESIRRRISSGQRALSRLRRGVAGAMLGAGLVAAVLYEVLLHQITATAAADPCASEMTLAAHALGAAVSAAFHSRFVLLGLAPLADDMRLTRLVMAIDSAVLVVAWSQVLPVLLHPDPQESPRLLVSVSLYANLLLGVGFLCGFARAMLCREAMSMQRYMWGTLSAWILLGMPLTVLDCVDKANHCRAFPSKCWNLVLQFLTFWFFCREPPRHRLQAALHRVFLAHSEARAAAGIAGLVGGCSAKQAALEAAARFRRVRLESLDYRDLADNTPDPTVYERSFPSKLRRCDAFVSHSWQDDALAKWKALQRWRADFHAAHGREPEIWFDKCCIDQNNIDADLRCLPIFLSGCRNLVVFCGTTYLSRLWCIMELFTFFHMGGSPDRVRLVPVLREGREHGDAELIQAGFAAFDAGRCSCYLAADKDRMLRIIHAAFGDLEEFNRAVRRMFVDVRWRAANDIEEGSGDLRMRKLPHARGWWMCMCRSLSGSSTGTDGSENSSSSDEGGQDHAGHAHECN